MFPIVQPEPTKPQNDPITIDVGIDSKVGIGKVIELNRKGAEFKAQPSKYHKSIQKEYTTTPSVHVKNVRHILVNCQYVLG